MKPALRIVAIVEAASVLLLLTSSFVKRVLDGPLARLTAREHEALALMAEGRTDKGIAAALFLSAKTAEAHVGSILRKLDLPADATENRRVHAVLAFLGAIEQFGEPALKPHRSISPSP